MTALIYSIFGGGLGWLIGHCFGQKCDLLLSRQDPQLINVIFAFILGVGFAFSEPFQSIITVACFSRVYPMTVIWNQCFLNHIQNKNYIDLSLSVAISIISGLAGYLLISYPQLFI
ncbi:MAG: hypothetical protein CMF42_02775 [Legionellales bacterium]|nr:hypothetical protein [Legionellales bacterium]OUX67698.1 MAG: hypothetical protein CBD38_01640 [bacterium TMED178]|tara:strand:- start:306 stop:653 length:348 start_codon:yes stop_codon:yes gene_type:complete